MANDIVYGRGSPRIEEEEEADELTVSALPDVQNLTDLTPRTLIIDGCSGSTYILGLSRRLMAAHGVSVHPLGEGGYHKEALLQNIGFYATDAERKELESLDTTGALALSMEIMGRRGQPLLFKMNEKPDEWEPSFEEVSSFLKKSAVRAVHVVRQNLLDWNICRVRDCFDGGALGHPVGTEGNESKLCFDRRAKPSIHTFAQLKPRVLVTRLQHDRARRARTAKLLKKAGLVKEKMYAEDLLGFEHISSGLDGSVEAWSKVLKLWGVEPKAESIRNVLSNEPMAAKLPDPGPHSEVVYNIGEVTRILERHSDLAPYLRL